MTTCYIGTKPQFPLESLIDEHDGFMGFWSWQPQFDQVCFDAFCAELVDTRSVGTNLLTTSAWLETIHPHDVGAVEEAMQQWLAGCRQTCWYTCRVRGTDGQWTWVLDRGGLPSKKGVPWRGRNLVGVRVLLPDPPSPGKQAAAERHYPGLWVSQEKSERKICAMIGHDIINNLAVIKGQAGRLQLNPEDRQFMGSRIDTINLAVDQIESLAAKLFNLSGQEIDKPNTKVELGAAAIEALAIYRHLIPDEIGCEFSPYRENLSVHVSKGDLFQIICNLLINARDSLLKRSGKREKRIRVAIDIIHGEVPRDEMIVPLTEGSYAVLSLEDTGVGIADGDRDKIFSPFFTTKAAGIGNGMGLTVVSEIVKKISGGLALHTLPGNGARFIVYFPLNMDATG